MQGLDYKFRDVWFASQKYGWSNFLLRSHSSSCSLHDNVQECIEQEVNCTQLCLDDYDATSTQFGPIYTVPVGDVADCRKSTVGLFQLNDRCYAAVAQASR
eukprot:6211343-Pleurochrysis_carterae.AAC.3